MASPGELVSVVASTLGINEATAFVYARHLREANLLTKGGRGRSAAKMSDLDAARLVVAFLATEAAVSAPQAVEDFGPLTLSDLELNRDEPTLTLTNLCGERFGTPHTFEEAVAALIHGFSDEAFIEKLQQRQWGTNPLGDGGFLPPFWIRAFENKLAAQIDISGNKYTYTLNVEKYGIDECSKILARWSKGLRITREVTIVEVREIGEKLIQ